jgi:hypothetical protein
MHELWLQKYIKEHYRQIGFTRLYGPYSSGADFKGIYAGKSVQIEAEWDYSDYIDHKHALGFADILVVATLEPASEKLKEKLPSVIMNLDREKIIGWAQPKALEKDREDYHSYPWRKLSGSLLCLYIHYRKHTDRRIDFIGSNLVHLMPRYQKPPGFQFGSGGKEESFEGFPEDKASWDYWLEVSHTVARHFRLKPALLRPTWIDRVALYFNHTGRITDGEFKRFKEVGLFIDDLILKLNN